MILPAIRRPSPPTPPPPGGDGRIVGREDLARAVEALGLTGRPLCLHSSLRSFGPVSGGADAVIDGLLDAGATVLVPSSTFRWCMAPRPDGPPLPGNAEDDGSIPPRGSVPPAGFSPLADFLDPAMGALP